MNEPLILELKESRLKDNDAYAAAFRASLKARGIYLVNVMSSPGSGKTSLLLKLLPLLSAQISCAVLQADIDGDPDARTLLDAGFTAIQVHTDGMCHLDAGMTEQSLNALPQPAEMVFLENIGNLVCPAEYDTGAQLNVVLLSIPEGDDKPFKYPLMFTKADAVIITKADTAAWFDFEPGRIKEALQKLNPSCPLFITSAKTNEGIDAVAAWLLQKRAEGLGVKK